MMPNIWVVLGVMPNPGTQVLPCVRKYLITGVFFAKPVQVDRVAARRRDASGGQPVQRDRGAVHCHIVSAQGVDRLSVIADIDNQKIDPRVIEPSSDLAARPFIDIGDGDSRRIGEADKVKDRFTANAASAAKTSNFHRSFMGGVSLRESMNEGIGQVLLSGELRTEKTGASGSGCRGLAESAATEAASARKRRELAK
jgi:hypothetical protein